MVACDPSELGEPDLLARRAHSVADVLLPVIKVQAICAVATGPRTTRPQSEHVKQRCGCIYWPLPNLLRNNPTVFILLLLSAKCSFI